MVLLILLLSGFVITDGSCYDYYLLYCCKCSQLSLMYLLDHVIFYRLVIWKARLITLKQRLKVFQLKRESKDHLDW